MAWLLLILLSAFAALLGVFLFRTTKERDSLGSRVGELESEAASKAAIQAERDKLAAAYNALRIRMQPVVDADAEKAKVMAQVRQIRDTFNSQLVEAKAKYAAIKQQREQELKSLEDQLAPLRAEHNALSEEAALLEMGYYKSRYGFATSQRYKKAIDENYANQRDMLKLKSAAICTTQWTVDGSAAKGATQTNRMLSLMLRAFNGECDSAAAKVKATNYQTMKNRIIKSFDTINKLGSSRGCQIVEQYKELRLDELQLEHEHALKIQAEREEQRAIREEMRQEAIAARELEKAREEAEREEQQYQTALDKAREDYERATAAKQEEMRSRIAELEQMVAEAHAQKERAMSLAQQTRRGHVYVISNIGSFGTNIYKIGMTRRENPEDRIWELSDASVPFDFDVHAIIKSDDAPSLENELHRHFSDRRMNTVNERKEFFYATIDEIAEVVREQCGDIELTLAAEAAEFMQSEAYRRENNIARNISRAFTPSALAVG